MVYILILSLLFGLLGKIQKLSLTKWYDKYGFSEMSVLTGFSPPKCTVEEAVVGSSERLSLLDHFWHFEVQNQVMIQA